LFITALVLVVYHCTCIRHQAARDSFYYNHSLEKSLQAC